MDEQGKPPSTEDSEKARAIYRKIAQDAENNRAEREQLSRSLSETIFAALPLDAQESKQMAELTAICNAHAAAVEPFNAKIDSTMDPAVLVGLLNCNQQFLQQLAGFEAQAKELESNGRPKLSQTLQAWKHETLARSALIQYVSHTRQPLATQPPPAVSPGNPPPVAPLPTPSPSPILNPQALLGIWDMVLANGGRLELALDNSSFSYARFDGTFAFWGSWLLDTQSGGSPLLQLTRRGGYPVAYYGPLGSQPLSYPPVEVWAITAFDANTIAFGNDRMTRRGQIQLPLVTANIAQVQANFTAADIRDQNNMALQIAQRRAIGSVQSAMWDYINSGAGRIK